MKMVRSVLLGSAASLVAVTAGQAADLPVKAQPVQYVKVCNMYGAGFYYMPGTEMCLKIGGWVRAEFTDQSNGSLLWGPLNGSQNNRSTNNLTVRARGYITADTREQTAYGVARGYIAVGLLSNDVGTTGTEGSNTFSANRAFVQWAGFTAGISRSFYDFYNAAALNYRGGYMATEDTGDGGWWTWAYTANFGGGFSGSISAEQRRMTQIVGQSTLDTVVEGGLSNGNTAGLGYGGWQVPDIVGNLRVEQAWGSAQVMAALHEVNAPYYGAATVVESNGHPSDAWGWAVGAGLHINTPVFGAGDFIEAEANYSQGASRYDAQTQNPNFLFTQGSSGGFGINSDCVYGGAAAAGNGTSCILTTAWSVVAGYEHYWTPQWHQSVTGSYVAESYSSGANNILCELEGAGIGGIGTGAGALAGCSNNWSYWTVGSRLQWDVTKSFYIGVEALYMNLSSAQAPGGLLPAAVAVGEGSTSTCGLATGNCTVNNQSDWEFTIRMHKDFMP
jgi:hypothetical protein